MHTRGPTARARCPTLPGAREGVKALAPVRSPPSVRRPRPVGGPVRVPEARAAEKDTGGHRDGGPPRGQAATSRSAVVAEVDVLERVASPEPRPGRGSRSRAEGRVQLGLGLLGGPDRDVAVAGQTRTGRDELAEDDVLLEAEQRVGQPRSRPR